MKLKHYSVPLNYCSLRRASIKIRANIGGCVSVRQC